MTPCSYSNCIISIISSIRRKANAFLERELEGCGVKGMCPTYGSILSLLYLNEGKLSMKEVADLIGRDKSTVTHLITRLIEAGFVTKKKCTIDCRVSYIELTEKARKVEKDFYRISERLVEKAYRGFSAAEKEELARLLAKLDGNF